MLAGPAFAAAPADSLPALIEEAISSHPSLAARQADIRAAQTGVEAARWQYWPTPSLTLEQADRATSAGADRQSTVFSLKQPLWTSGRIDAGLTQASASQTAAEASLQEARRDLALEVIQAYGDAYAAQSRVAAFEQSLSVHDRLLAQVKRRAEEGLSAPSDIQLAQSRHAAVVAERAYAAAQRGTALQRLQTLAGRPLTGTLTAPGEIQGAAEPLDPTLARLNAEVTQLEAEARKARAALWPEVYARADQRHGDVSGNHSQILIALESRWGAGLSTPTAAETARHRIAAKHSEIAARSRKISEQIQSDRQLLDAARLRVQSLQAAKAAAVEVSDSWDRQFLAGKKSWQDVMNAAREAAQTETQLADAQAAVIVTGWRLAVLTQGVEQVQGSRGKLQGNSLEP